MYDYVIVGAGLFGAICAHELALQGKKIKVIEKRNHIAGNIYTKEVEGIHVHEYGAHIFHTSNEQVWRYINQFTTFHPFINSPIANFRGEIYNLPFNMNTFNKLWGVVTPQEAQEKIEQQKKEALGDKEPQNLEEQAISLVGTDIYQKLIKGYTEKQWGEKATKLPSFIIKRLPVRYTYNNNYFNDIYQGIPTNGYTAIVENMLNHPNISVELGIDFFENREHWLNQGEKLIFTGMIDQFFNYEYGTLAYRSLRFEHEYLNNIDNYQGNAVVNYTDVTPAYTRIIEHKHFQTNQPESISGTMITKEYPADWEPGIEPYYPVNNDENNALYQRYAQKAAEFPNIIFGGRLGTYRYYDMDKIVEQALKTVENELK
ncbi:UDP-galactopyranose mutase [Catellicoccus marimammalium]|uniref:UDP-galactopyranose mutase n=1 Tax=Catellicoccus marimammalium M35/04/3 TaxID=1234409 RepID=K8ZL00_9ENTE|nr:UDP-galactopyranose mutase [Catellicoccus marimammalium]EKU27258.1 UDP-galactopyranose mutase [Catellicoccus marimammalium M35/04/3]